MTGLTERECQVVQLIGQGKLNKQIAYELGMSEHTLRNHLTVIYSKLNVQGKLNLYVFAVQHRIAPDVSLPGEHAVRAGSAWSLSA